MEQSTHSPDLSLPPGSTTVQVSVIDTTTRMKIPAHQMLTPTTHLPSNATITAPSYAFLIQHPSGQNLLFDLGLRKDWWNLTPHTTDFLKTFGWEVNVTKNVDEILLEGGITPNQINAVIWSHHHFDHRGDITLFPSSTELVFGPGLEENYLPGYPGNSESTVLEEEWSGRRKREVVFDDSDLKIGGFRAVDFFGDGSFYLLDCPGHTHGHIAGLARIQAGRGDSSGDRFVLMGGDTCHFTGQIRPSRFRPLPIEGGGEGGFTLSGVCPGEIMERVFSKCNPGEPLFQMPEPNAVDIKTAHESIRKLQAFDAADNVLVVIAHDESLLGQMDFYPKSIGAWERRAVGEEAHWGFLNILKDEL